MPRSRRRDDRPAPLEGFWLTQRPNSARWCRTSFDPAARQTRRASLGTGDFEEAKRALAEFVLREVPCDRADPRNVPLARVFARYEGGHIRRKLDGAGGAAQRRSLDMILARVAEGATVAEFNIREQERLADAMEAEG